MFHLLKQNSIRYVAFDNAVRSAQFINRSNEQVYATYFPKVFEDNQVPMDSSSIRCLTRPFLASAHCLKVSNILKAARDNLIRPLESLLMRVGMFLLLIRTTVGSRSSRLRMRFTTS